VEQRFQTHIRKVKDKIVFLEALGPRRRDGNFEIGSEQAIIENHLEVQHFH
jgi:hypothetical protein